MNKIVRVVSGWSRYLWSFKDHKNPEIWVFGEWFGKRCGDNCAYFANYLAEQDKNLRLYWICKKDTDTAILDKRIERLEMDSKEAIDVLKKASVIFMNQNYLDLSSKPDNIYGKAITFNFWHGFPWKKIGHDRNKRDSTLFRLYCSLINPIVEARYFNTLSDVYSEKLKSAFGVKENRLIRAGAPRNRGLYSRDFIVKSRKIVEEAINNVNSSINKKDLKIVAYMPTFRDAGDLVCNLGEMMPLDYYQWLEENNVVIIQKAHFIDAEKNFDSTMSFRERVFSMPLLNAATLMAASDILISDYSSCVFDYLLLDRPVIHFIYDYEKYRDKDRGLYFEIEEIACGNIVRGINELCDDITEAINHPEEGSELRREKRDKLLTYETPSSAEIIYQFVKKQMLAH